jgi:hypothetical protein
MREFVMSMPTLFHHGHYFRVTTDDRCAPAAKPVWAAPLSQPGKYLALLDSSGEQVAMVEDPATLAPDSRAALEEELRRRYLTAFVRRIVEIDPQHGTTYFMVETDRGERNFVVQQLQDNAVWFGETRLLLVDVDGNRFEVANVKDLDTESQALIRKTL